MTVVINGTTGITNPNNMTIGNGGGNISTNTAVGASALAANTTGASNTAIGNGALNQNTTASYNTAVGYQAGYSNTASDKNTFIGTFAGYGYNNSTGNHYNLCVGYAAGYGLTTGTTNTFVGGNACGQLITTGSKNTIIGGYSGNQGGLDIRTASNYIVLSDGDGNPRLYCDANDFYSPSSYSNTTGNATNLTVLSNGIVRRSTSALKYKQDVRDLESIDITTFRPVRYKSACEGDDQTIDRIGFIADWEAEAGHEELVSRGADGEIEGFQYERMTAVLVKAIQELNAKVDAQAAEIAALKA